jgi:hypothetical protein
MSLIPMDSAHIQQVIQNDANQLRATLSWLTQRDQIYQLNMTLTNMTAAGISGNATSGDQQAILSLVADIHRCMQFMQGTLPGVAGDTRVSTAGVLGVT